MGVEALCSFKSFTPNAAASQHSLPFPVVIDLVFSDASRRSRVARRSSRVAAASRGRRNRVVSSSSSDSSAPRHSTFGTGVTPVEQQLCNRGLDSCICRANSFDRSGVPERENEEEFCGKGIRKQPEAGNGQEEDSNAQRRSSMVSLKFGSANRESDGFRRASSIDFEDEFFKRMIALEASHHSCSRASDLRACSSSSATVFDVVGNGATLSGASEPPRASPGQGVEQAPGASTEALCVLGMGGVQLPSSIKKLRRRNSEVKGENSRSLPATKEPRGCAIKNAFSSMVYMIKAVQSHALQIRQVLFSEWDVQEVLLLVQREMHSSFVWLFQQVFACTPKLMVSVMILLANFTVYSMGENVAIATVTETPAPIAFFLSTYGNPQASLDPNFAENYSQMYYTNPLSSSPHPGPSSAGSGGNNYPYPRIAPSFDGDAWLNGALNENFMFSQKDSLRDAPARKDVKKTESELEQQRPSHHEMMKAWVESSMKDLEGEPVVQNVMEQETIRRLVAPVVAHLESDNYACFDRTDLEYRHALSKDPSNALLLANYAQFLYVVRHDHDRYVPTCHFKRFLPPLFMFPFFQTIADVCEVLCCRAEGYFHQAMQVDPLDSAILGRFASFLWLGRGNRSAAERAYKAAMAADPDSSFPASNYAHFLWHVGDGESLGPSGPMTA